MKATYSIGGQEVAPAELGEIALVCDAIVAVCNAVRRRVGGG